MDEIDGGNESEEESTTTESLIERSKKYMDKEAGIIILRRNDDEPKNFNINLDFDLKDQYNKKRYHNVSTIEEESSQKSDDKDFNIEMDFDLKKRQPPNKRDNDFNINMDFDLKNNRARPKKADENDFNANVDSNFKNKDKRHKSEKDFNIAMDFDIGKRGPALTGDTLNSSLIDHDKSFDIDMDFGGPNHVRRFVNVDYDTGVGIDVIVTNNKQTNDDDEDRVLYEETIHYQELNDDEVKKINAQPENLEDYLRRAHPADKKFIMHKKGRYIFTVNED